MTCGLTRQSLMNISSSWTNQQAITTKKPKPATLVQTKLNAREISAMTVKCTFCNDTKQEPGIPGPCVWCETAAESIKFGTGIMFVGADGAKNVPLVDFLIETKAFRLLPYGTKFRYQGTQDVWVRIGHNLVAKWPCDLFGRDGQPCQSLCSFCHLEGDDPGDTLETLVEVVDSDLALIAERDAALGRETALREERATLRESYESMRDRKNSIVDLQKRLTVAEQRAVKFEELLLQTNEMLYQIQGDPGAVPSSSIDAMRGEVFTALKPAAEAHKCIECESQYCHGVCVERGDDYERYKGAEGEGS